MSDDITNSWDLHRDHALMAQFVNTSLREWWVSSGFAQIKQWTANQARLVRRKTQNATFGCLVASSLSERCIYKLCHLTWILIHKIILDYVHGFVIASDRPDWPSDSHPFTFGYISPSRFHFVFFCFCTFFLLFRYTASEPFINYIITPLLTTCCVPEKSRIKMVPAWAGKWKNVWQKVRTLYNYWTVPWVS